MRISDWSSDVCSSDLPPILTFREILMSASQIAIPCIVMRGGTSKGPYFMAKDLPSDSAQRDSVLLAAMGSPDARQIEALGGSTTLSSKVCMATPTKPPGTDVDYHLPQQPKRLMQGKRVTVR